MRPIRQSASPRSAALLLCAALAALPSCAAQAADAGAAPTDATGDEALRIVAKQTLEFTAPAGGIPSDKMVDGPLLGNGDLGVTIAGAPDALRFHIGKNDFWGQKTQSPQTVGCLKLLVPELAGAPYKASYDMLRARWTGEFAKDGAALRVGAFVDANANRLVLTLDNTGSKPLTLSAPAFRGTTGAGAPTRVNRGDKPVMVGFEQFGGGRWHFKGEMSDLAVVDEVLSAERIAEAAKAPRGAAQAFDGRTTRPITVPDITDPLTITGWVKADAFDEANYILSQGEWNKGYSLGFSGGHLRFNINGTILQTDKLPTGKWMHVAAVHDGQRMTIHVDGRPVKALGDDTPVSSFLHAPDGDRPEVRRAALVARIVGTDKDGITLAPGAKATVAAVILSDLDAKDPLAEAKAQASALTPAKITAAAKAHEAWWTAFWRKSFVEIPDKKLERHWYASQYIMASCSRAGKVAPGLWGNWITKDSTAWHGDFHLNYNFEAPYYAVYAANHPEVSLPFYDALTQSIPRGRKIAEKRGSKGVFLPVSIGPWGMCPEGDDSHHGQKSNAAYAALNFVWYWQHTQDRAWLAKTGYPYLREVEKYWTTELKKVDGRYVVEHDAIHEQSGGAGHSGVSSDFNSILTLGLLRTLYAGMLETSAALGVDADLRPKWREILAHLSDFPTQEKDGKTVFRYTEKGTPWWDGNTLGIQHIYPAGAIGLDSDLKLLEISRNMIDAMGRWSDYNGSSSWYTTCARVGYDPERTLAEMRRMYDRHAMPNGILYFGGGGIENAAPTLAITEMLMQSHEGVVRLFPSWPAKLDARFGTLRARGAFLVSAELKGGEVSGVEIASEKGMPLTVKNPWPGKSVVVSRGGKPAETVSGDRFTLKTRAGETIGLSAK